MPYTDAIGVWQELDFTALTVSEDWQLYPNDCNPGVLFRFKFDTDWTAWENKQGYRSFGLIRFHYHDDSGNFGWVTPSRAIYPKKEELLIELPSLSTLKDNPWTIRKIAVKRVKQRYPTPAFSGITFDNYQPAPVLNWSLYVEYLIN